MHVPFYQKQDGKVPRSFNQPRGTSQTQRQQPEKAGYYSWLPRGEGAHGEHQGQAGAAAAAESLY